MNQTNERTCPKCKANKHTRMRGTQPKIGAKYYRCIYCETNWRIGRDGKKVVRAPKVMEKKPLFSWEAQQRLKEFLVK